MPMMGHTHSPLFLFLGVWAGLCAVTDLVLVGEAWLGQETGNSQ